VTTNTSPQYSQARLCSYSFQVLNAHIRIQARCPATLLLKSARLISIHGSTCAFSIPFAVPTPPSSVRSLLQLSSTLAQPHFLACQDPRQPLLRLPQTEQDAPPSRLPAKHPRVQAPLPVTMFTKSHQGRIHNRPIPSHHHTLHQSIQPCYRVQPVSVLQRHESQSMRLLKAGSARAIRGGSRRSLIFDCWRQAVRVFSCHEGLWEDAVESWEE
jgi:hypothetical protein